MKHDEPEMTEDGAYPAQPDNEYGWEKLYAERFALTASRHFPIEVRIARFQNCYGPEGTWIGGREKAPAAICRKVAETHDGFIEIYQADIRPGGAKDFFNPEFTTFDFSGEMITPQGYTHPFKLENYDLQS